MWSPLKLHHITTDLFYSASKVFTQNQIKNLENRSMGLLKFLRRHIFKRRRRSADKIGAADDPAEDCYGEVEKLGVDFGGVIGYGGFSTVYRARFKDLSTVAVKRYISSSRLDEVYKQESEILGRLRHDNIVKLLGHYHDGDQGVLILEYIPNGTLQEQLHGPNTPPLPWRSRMTIAYQLARAISYLHDTHRGPHIVHGDIKPSNILLDSALNCKLCDFGSAKAGFSSAVLPPPPDGPLPRNHHRRLLMGSPGYADPAYLTTGLATKKNDVYGFGVVVLEMVTGMEAVEPVSGERLTAWAEPMMKDGGKVAGMVDRRLVDGEVDLEEAKKMVRLAARCVCGSPEVRPSASEIVAFMRNEIRSLSFLLKN